MDILSAQERSILMAKVHSKDTAPERLVRSLVHRMGFRYRLHDRKLPGCPDLVFSSRRKIIFVHGCFWHQHHCARGNRIPTSNRAYWQVKLRRNQARDVNRRRTLRRLGWRVMIVWECQVNEKSLDRLSCGIASFLTR